MKTDCDWEDIVPSGRAFPEDKKRQQRLSWLRTALGLREDEPPFPWQERLLDDLVAGKSPSALDIPTGLGKTAVMAIWLVAHAACATSTRVPRRLIYVVDRRAVVDQATTVAERLRAWVESDAVVKSALGLAGPLPVSTLRGQYVDNKAWLENPAVPAIVLGTVDMIGSRLLFSGYGVSRRMRPYHAGFLGTDALIVLDEAHLVPGFEDLLRQMVGGVAGFGAQEPSLQALLPKFILLSLSATGRQTDAPPFALNDEDRANSIVNKRLTAKKSLTVVELGAAREALDADRSPSAEQQSERGRRGKSPKLAEELAELAWKLTRQGADAVRCLVFCNAREDAKAVVVELRNLAKAARAPEPTVELFVGARRIRERTQAQSELEKLGFLAGTKVSRERAIFLVATSAGEVGVDLDADHMVCDLVAWERMVQRLGRVNRRGEGDARVVIAMGAEPSPSKKEQSSLDKKGTGKFKDADAKAVARYEAELAMHRALRNLLDAIGQGGSLSPEALLQLRQRADLAEALRDATTAESLRPELTRALVDAWSMTSLDVHPGRPKVDPWLRGFRPSDPPQTTLVWRRYLPVRVNGDFDAKAARRFFEAAPPHASESLETDTHLVLDWLVKRADAAAQAKPEDSRLHSDAVVVVVLDSGGEVKGWRSVGQLREAKKDDKRKKELTELLTGMTLIVDARLGGLTAGQTGGGLLDDKVSVIAPAADDDTTVWLSRPDELDVPVTGFRILRLRVGEQAEGPPASNGPSGERWVQRHQFVLEAVDGEPSAVLAIDGWPGDGATEEERAEANRPQLLDEHQQWAADAVRTIAQQLGLPKRYEDLLAMAARLHDEGKRAAHWQRAFRAPRDGVYAKTRGPIDFDLLDGYRHEFGSLPYAEKDGQLTELSDEDEDFVLHLIAAHHGFARPSIGTRGCDAPESLVEARALDVALRFARLSRQWGPWGLAWWEALLRAADQTASRRNQQAGSSATRKGQG